LSSARLPGGAAYGPALIDVVIMSGDGRVFVTGPDVVRKVTGGQVDMGDLGGLDPHGRRSGVVHGVAGSEAEAIRQARCLTGLLAESGIFESCTSGPDLRSLLPDWARRAYVARKVSAPADTCRNIPLINRIGNPMRIANGRTGEI
jgi:acetyl-CoA/propionyl-CoA carboxylase carboxyl transferase subunit